jgi:hypothetical protein
MEEVNIRLVFAAALRRDVEEKTKNFQELAAAQIQSAERLEQATDQEFQAVLESIGGDLVYAASEANRVLNELAEKNKVPVEE